MVRRNAAGKKKRYMTEAQFVAANQARWNDFEGLLKPKTSRFKKVADAWSFPRAYRKICRDLNQARASRFSLNLIDTLNRQVWEGHQILYHNRTNPPLSLIGSYILEFPRQLRRFGLMFLLCHVLFYGLVGLTFLYAHNNPAQLESFLGSKMMEDLKTMYDPANTHELRPKGVESDADMFGFYIYNNITIGFRTFAGGILAGFGSLFFLIYNALFMGAVMAYINSIGYNQPFYQFVLGHGAFELTAVIIFALAGFELGKVIISPGRKSRAAMLRDQGQAVLPLVAGAAFFLFIAACLEAFWSARPMDPVIKYAVAGGLWILVYGFLFFGARHARTS
jgi:uncharacterized membrane protein SpoIIM required for sporulation